MAVKIPRAGISSRPVSTQTTAPQVADVGSFTRTSRAVGEAGTQLLGIAETLKKARDVRQETQEEVASQEWFAKMLTEVEQEQDPDTEESYLKRVSDYAMTAGGKIQDADTRALFKLKLESQASIANAKITTSFHKLNKDILRADYVTWEDKNGNLWANSEPNSKERNNILKNLALKKKKLDAIGAFSREEWAKLEIKRNKSWKEKELLGDIADDAEGTAKDLAGDGYQEMNLSADERKKWLDIANDKVEKNKNEEEVKRENRQFEGNAVVVSNLNTMGVAQIAQMMENDNVDFKLAKDIIDWKRDPASGTVYETDKEIYNDIAKLFGDPLESFNQISRNMAREIKAGDINPTDSANLMNALNKLFIQADKVNSTNGDRDLRKAYRNTLNFFEKVSVLFGGDIPIDTTYSAVKEFNKRLLELEDGFTANDLYKIAREVRNDTMVAISSGLIDSEDPEMDLLKAIAVKNLEFVGKRTSKENIDYLIEQMKARDVLGDKALLEGASSGEPEGTRRGEAIEEE